MTLRTSSTSAARAHEADSAMKSTPSRERPAQVLDVLLRQRRHARRRRPGRLMPLLLLTLPPTTTVVCTSVPSTAVDHAGGPCRRRSGSGRPRGRRRAGPCTSSRRRCASPGTSRVVIVNSWPCSSFTGPSANVPSRILGPCRSAKMPTPWPVASEASPHQAVDAARGRRSRRGSCSAGRRPCRRRPARRIRSGVDDGRAQGADDLGSTHDFEPSGRWIDPSTPVTSGALGPVSTAQRALGRRDRATGRAVEPVR